MWAIIFQTVAAGIVGGVGIAWIAYAIGADRVLVTVIRHPLRSFETAVLTVVAFFPPPVVKSGYQGRHAGRHGMVTA